MGCRLATGPSNTHLNPSSSPRAASRIGPCAPLGRPCHLAAAGLWGWGSLPSPDGCPAFPLCPPCPRCPGARAPVAGCSGTLPRSCAKCKVSRSFTTGHAGRSGGRESFRHRAGKHPPESLVQSSRSTATLMSTGASAGNPSAGFLLAEQRPFVSPGMGVGARGLDQRPSSHQQVGIVTPWSAPLP